MAGGNAHVPELYELYVKRRKITGPDEQSVRAGDSLLSVKCAGNVEERSISSSGMSMDAEVQGQSTHEDSPKVQTELEVGPFKNYLFNMGGQPRGLKGI